MKICFTTALFGDPKFLDTPPKFERNPNYDYFLFTDIDEEHFDTSWDVINIKDNPNISNLSSNTRKSRYPKFMSWELLESLGKSYDVVFYCDAYIIPNTNMQKPNQSWNKITSDIMNKKTFSFMQEKHRKDFVRKGGIVAECYNITKQMRDSSESIQKTINFFKNYDPSVDLQFPQYFENTVFGYKFNDKTIRDFTKKFWEIYTKEDITYRDQPLWNFLLLKYGYKPLGCHYLSWKSISRNKRRRVYFLSNEKSKTRDESKHK
jgi:hypothetical protein